MPPISKKKIEVWKYGLVLDVEPITVIDDSGGSALEAFIKMIADLPDVEEIIIKPKEKTLLVKVRR